MGKLRFRRVTRKGWWWVGGHKVDWRTPLERYLVQERAFYAAWHFVVRDEAAKPYMQPHMPPTYFYDGIGS